MVDFAQVKRSSICCIVLCTAWFSSIGQVDTIPDVVHPYKVNRWVSIGGVAGATAIALWGQDRILGKADLTLNELAALEPDDVPGIDRVALRQPLNRYARARKVSDYGINYFPLLPAVLFIDRRMRQDWFDISLVYAEAQIAVLNVYTWTFLGPTFIERVRPISFYEGVPLDERTWGGNRNSFYSGHTSTVSTTTFFMAKSYLDYHPEKRHLKWLLYSIAALPPAYVSVKRVQALKHYPTDVIVGYIVGAAGGLLWPELHKSTAGKMSITMAYDHDFKLARLTWVF